MKHLLTLAFVFAAAPAFAASGPFFSLKNTDFVVLLGFLLFVGILVYFKVPALIGRLLDGRATAIKTELDEARALRDEAQALLASFEKKQREVAEQANRIVAQARDEAGRAAETAKADIATSVARRIAAAEDQIRSAEAAAVKEVRDQAVVVAVSVARDAIAKQMTADQANVLIDTAIDTVAAKLH